MSQRQRLDWWKLIAGHLGRSVRTVQRWEAEEGLPVLRLNHEQRGSVYAYVDELDSWWKARSESAAVEPVPARQFPWWILVAAGTVLVFGVVILDSRKATNPAQLPVPLTTFP